jgi:hypothetical protein
MEKNRLPAGAGWLLGGLTGLVIWIITDAIMDKNGVIVGFMFYLSSFIIIGSFLEPRTRSLPPREEQHMQQLILAGIILLSLAMIGFLLMYLWQ